MNITVYLGASQGTDPCYEEAVRELGRWIGRSGNGLVYGGSRIGLMGILAEEALQAGAEVTGVEPGFFVNSVMQLEGLTQLIEVETMAERRSKMIELGDAFVAFPGGTGTLDEISEIMMMCSLGLLEKPCVIYNLNHYYDLLRAQLEHMQKEGFLREDAFRWIRFADTLDQVAEEVYRNR